MKNVPYGIALSLMGLAPFATAWTWPSPWFVPLLAWTGASFFAVGAAYLGVGPRLFGKRADGTLSGTHVGLLLPYFAASAILLWLHRVVLRERPCDDVGGGLYVAAALRSHELPADVSVVVDLTAELGEPRAIRDRVRYHLLPTLDGCAPELTDRARTLVRELGRLERERILVHCAFGHGRSAAVAAAVLVTRGVARDVGEAVALMRRSRPQIRMTSAQRAWVQKITDSTLAL